LLSSAGLGELGGGIVMMLMAGRLDAAHHRVLGAAIILAGIGFVLYSVSQVLAAADAALTLASLSYPPMNVAFATLRQRATPDGFMGRVGSLSRSAMELAILISLAAAGALADAFGVRTVIAAGGAALLGCGLLSFPLMRDSTS
jgi:predicted MFS family arabinose efflux permease